MAISEIRQNYQQGSLNEDSTDPNPFRQFEQWLNEAIAYPFREPNAMALATSMPDGTPSVRMVLLRRWDERGFVFYTNCESQKGRELAANPKASLVFWWDALERQVRISGTVEQVADSEADAYFQTRPRGHQLGAWVSQQSHVIESRAALEARLKEVEAQFAGKPVPRPPYWSGFRVVPEVIEFWQGRENRLHDRLRYTPQSNGKWLIERLQP